MLKKVTITITFLFAVCLFTVAAAQPVQAFEQQKDIAVFVNGVPIQAETPPLIHNNRVLIPFRAVAEALDVAVTWDSASATISAEGGGKSVQLKVDNTTAQVNNNSVSLDVPPLMINARAMIPLRFFGEAFGCTVLWDSTDQQITITSPSAQTLTITGFYAMGDQKTSSWQNLFEVNYPETSIGHTNIVSSLALGWFTMDSQGNLLTVSNTGWQKPEGWENVLEAADKYRLNTEMVIYMNDNAGSLFDLINDQTAMDNAISAIRQEASLYRGVNLDFEELGLTEDSERLQLIKNNFTQFVRQLAMQLKQDGLSLTLTLHPPNSYYRGYDYQALGQIADKIIIMAYEYGPKPEPASKVTEAVEMALAVVPAEKLILGISAPSETSNSIGDKIAIAKRYHLNGIALWRLGLIDNEMWSKLEQNN